MLENDWVEGCLVEEVAFDDVVEVGNTEKEWNYNARVDLAKERID